jgi:hypothetical protein
MAINPVPSTRQPTNRAIRCIGVARAKTHKPTSINATTAPREAVSRITHNPYVIKPRAITRVSIALLLPITKYNRNGKTSSRCAARSFEFPMVPVASSETRPFSFFNSICAVARFTTAAAATV